MTTPLGVGIIGAGPVTQAIHLPTLARLATDFTVVHVMDVDVDVAAAVAARVGARASVTMDEVMADDAVQVVAICSPPAFHAVQVEAAIAARKKAVLCEKPFAVSAVEAERMATLSEQSGVPIIVGAMHTFDPAWVAATENWGDLAQTAHTVHSTIVLPPNPRYEDWATQIHSRPESQPRSAPVDTAGHVAALRGAILGLAIHNLPLVRRLVPTIDSVDMVRSFAPVGYLLTLRGDGRLVELFGHMHTQWRPEWTFDAWGASNALHVEFPPSYVQAGSAVATLTDMHGARTLGPYPVNGYEQEWRRIAELARGAAQPAAELRALVDDLAFAVDIADRASELILRADAA